MQKVVRKLVKNDIIDIITIAQSLEEIVKKDGLKIAMYLVQRRCGHQLTPGRNSPGFGSNNFITDVLRIVKIAVFK